MKKLAHSILVAGVLLSGATAAQGGPVVYNQPATFPGTTGSVWTSETSVADGPVWQVWDRFVLGSNQTIGAATWQGIYVAEHRARPHRREVLLSFIGSRRTG